MKYFLLFGIICITAFCISPLQYVGSELWASFERIKADGDYLYAGCPYGVGVFDISDSLNCNLVEWYYINATVSGIDTAGNYLYLAAGTSGLIILNKSNPRNLIEVSRVPLSDEAIDVDVQGNYAYIAGKVSGLHVINVSNPASPTQVGFLTVTGGSVNLVVDGNYVYLCRGLGGFSIIDVTNPASPSFRGSYSSSAYIREAKKKDNYVFLAAEILGMIVLDVSNPTAPTAVGSYPAPTGRTFTCIDIKGNIAYIGASNYGIMAITITNPTAPVFLDHYPVSLTSVLKVCTKGGMLFITTPEGLQVADISTVPADIAFISRTDRHTGIERVWAGGSKLMTASGSQGLDAFSVVDPSSPLRTFFFSGGTTFNDAVYSAHYIYVAAGAEGLAIFRSNSLGFYPTFVTQLSLGSNATRVEKVGSICYVLTAAGIAQVDVSTPGSPALRRTAICTQPRAFFATNDYVYVCDRTDGFLVFETVGMTLVGREPAASGNNYKDLTVSGNCAYAAAGGNGIIVVNISNPTNPLLSATIRTSDDATAISATNNWLYVSIDRAGVQPFKILGSADSLIEYEAYNTGGRAMDVSADGGYIFVADRYALLIFRNDLVGIGDDIALPEKMEIIAYPNPFNSSVRMKIQNSEYRIQNIEIFDINGKRVREFEGSRVQGKTEFVWQPDNATPSGIYLVRTVMNDRKIAEKRIVYLK